MNPNKKTIRLFASPMLERLTRTHALIPVSVFLLYGASLLVFSILSATVSYLAVVLLYAAGLLTFTWVEYQVHRRIFHIKGSTRRRATFQYTVHGVHHHFPEDKSRLAMPPVLSIAIATVLLIIFKLIAGNMSFAFLAGFFNGYAAYLLVHYLVHTFRPPKTWFRILWKLHFIHHYKDDTRAFGVSSPLWDYIYRTMPEKSK